MMKTYQAVSVKYLNTESGKCNVGMILHIGYPILHIYCTYFQVCRLGGGNKQSNQK